MGIAQILNYLNKVFIANVLLKRIFTIDQTDQFNTDRIISSTELEVRPLRRAARAHWIFELAPRLSKHSEKSADYNLLDIRLFSWHIFANFIRCATFGENYCAKRFRWLRWFHSSLTI